VPSLNTMFAEYRLTAAADAIRAGWETARTQAMNEGQPYRFAVVPDKGNYRIAPDSPEFWSTGGSTTGAEGSPRAFERNGTLPRGVRFRNPDGLGAIGGTAEGSGDSALELDAVSPDQWSTVATFLPDGTTREDVTIVLDCEGTRPIVIQLRSLTGTVKVRPYSP
jgi:hypothetical protein